MAGLSAAAAVTDNAGMGEVKDHCLCQAETARNSRLRDGCRRPAMTTLDLRTIARALRGEVSGRRVLAPGPQHSPKDRSLCVTAWRPPRLAASLCTALPATTRSSARTTCAIGLVCRHGSLATSRIAALIRLAFEYSTAALSTAKRTYGHGPKMTLCASSTLKCSGTKR